MGATNSEEQGHLRVQNVRSSDTSCCMTGNNGVAAVTGAARGLGAAYARALASRNYDLFLTDRDSEALRMLARELQQSAPVRVEATVADLTQDADIERIQAHLGTMDDLSLLINNAGFGTFSLFHEADLSRQLDMVHVHVLATIRFCHAVLPGMITRKAGGIINVASAAAFMRFPENATYTGTKSFLVAFTECLAIELVNTGVSVQAFCPAWVRTSFFNAAEDPRQSGHRSPLVDCFFIPAEQAVASSLQAMGRTKVAYTPTIKARLATSLVGSPLGLAALARIRERRGRRGTS